MMMNLTVGQRYRHRWNGRICELRTVGIFRVRYSYDPDELGAHLVWSGVATFIERFRPLVSDRRAV